MIVFGGLYIGQMDDVRWGGDVGPEGTDLRVGGSQVLWGMDPGSGPFFMGFRRSWMWFYKSGRHQVLCFCGGQRGGGLRLKAGDQLGKQLFDGVDVVGVECGIECAQSGL